VVHGIPSAQRVLRGGDLLSLDFGVLLDGFHADAAVTVPVGEIDEASTRLIEVAREALRRAVAEARPGRRVGDLGAAVQGHVEACGFSVVRDFVGHGVGRRLHEPPQIPNYGLAGTGIPLRAGMVLAIEPMVNAGGAGVDLLDDGWTAVTQDGRRSAHFEHTVAVTENAPEILTLPVDGAAVQERRGG
jgi:methionyl aminopeptidase